jgi:hypothetical protein
MDIIQRFMRVGLRGQRFGQLVAFHLRQRPSRGRVTALRCPIRPLD